MKQISIDANLGTTIKILSIPELAILNCNLGYFEKKILPFIKSMNNENSVYMYTTQLRVESTFMVPDKKKCDDLVSNILTTSKSLYPDISIGYKPVNVKRIYL